MASKPEFREPTSAIAFKVWSCEYVNGLVLSYGLVLVAALVGLLRGRAAAQKYFWLPVIALAATIVGALLIGALSKLWPAPPGVADSPGRMIAAAVLLIIVGFIAGRSGPQKTSDRSHQRGAVVMDGAGEQNTTHRLPMSKIIDTTLAGV